MGVFETLRNLFRREHTYVLYLNRRGRPLEIDTFKARNMEEAVSAAKEIIEGLNPEEVPDITKYKTFKLVEDTGKTKLLKNPFFEERDIGDIDEREIAKLAIASVAEKIPDIISSSIETVMSVQSKITMKLLTEMMDSLIKVYKKQLGLEQDPIEALKALAVIVANWDKAKELVKTARERLLAGGRVGGEQEGAGSG